MYAEIWSEMWPLLTPVAIGAAVMMLALWALHYPLKDAGVVDVGWAFGLGAAAVYYAIAADGDHARRVLVGVLGGVWGLRLAWHLLTDRVLAPEEDGRYASLRAQLGSKFGPLMLPFFQAQALLVILLSVPFLLASISGRELRATDFIGAGLWIVGIVGESVADAQLRRFKRRSDSKGRTCREGLWRYSRHPNYFFEWLMWCAYAALALSSQLWWAGLAAPLLMLFLILKVTGVPPTEKRALESRGDDYRRYQRETNAFFPWFPKTEQA